MVHASKQLPSGHIKKIMFQNNYIMPLAEIMSPNPNEVDEYSKISMLLFPWRMSRWAGKNPIAKCARTSSIYNINQL